MRTAMIDQQTIDRAMQGDKEAFATLVRATGSRSLIIAERILRSPDDAISAARKFFVITYANLKKLKDLGVLELWLMQNLVRVCGESIKEAAKKGVALPQCEFPKDLAAAGLLDSVGVVDAAAVAGVAEPSPVAQSVAGAVSQPSAAAQSRASAASRRASIVAKRREAVRKAMDCLPFLERTAVIFRDWDGMSYLQVAEILRVKNDDTRKLLVRGRKGVAEMLKPHAVETKCDKTCSKLRDKVWLFVGGEIGPAEQADVRVHLSQCPNCANFMRMASTVLEAIRDAAPLEDKPLIAPEMLWKEVEPLLTR